jgi:hypothetical protein
MDPNSTASLRRLLLCIFVAVFLVGPAFAGEIFDKTIKGKVTSKIDGAALPGVSIVVKGTQVGTSTDATGNYSINVNEASRPVLVFSYIGHETQEVTVGNESVINVGLAEGVETLNETVVTALGLSREKRSLGYTVAEVDGKDISRVAQENVLNSLAGRVPGVTISSTGGTGFLGEHDHPRRYIPQQRQPATFCGRRRAHCQYIE